MAAEETVRDRTLLFYAIALALLYLAYKMFSPFLLAILRAIVLSIVFYPLYEFIRTRARSENIAAVVVVIISLLLFVGPLTYMSYLLAGEASQIIKSLNEPGLSALLLENSNIKARVEDLARLLNIPSAEISNALEGLSLSVKKSLMNFFHKEAREAVHAIVSYFIMLFTIFFLLRDGKLFVSMIYKLLPLSELHKDHLITRIREVVVSTMYGGVMIALLDGVIGGISFYLLGVPSPILLGFALSIFSFIPIIGAFTIWGPVTAYLFLSASTVKGIIMAVIGGVVIAGIIDHIVKPRVLGQRAKIHTVLIFFGVLGGIHLFGVIGFVAGPLVIAMLLVVMQIIEERLEENP
jgi:predicted PurR-regulated permease PerM